MFYFNNRVLELMIRFEFLRIWINTSYKPFRFKLRNDSTSNQLVFCSAGELSKLQSEELSAANRDLDIKWIHNIFREDATLLRGSSILI